MAEVNNEYILAELKSQFGEDIISSEEPHGFLTVTADSSRNLDIINFLYDHEVLKFQFLTSLCGIHYPESDKPFGVVVQLHSLTNYIRLRLKFFLSEENPELNTLTSVYAAANWLERETYDFYGIKFKDHPDLRRILNVDEMVVFPLRKEYPLEDPNRRDKEDLYFGR